MTGPAGKEIRLVITGGGTGGHLFPGVAVAEAILATRPGSEVLFIGTDRQVDSRVLGNRPFASTAIKCQGLKGQSIIRRLSALGQLPLAVWQSRRLLKKFRPDLVLGVGGYVTGPVVAAAWLAGIPTCIHEQNSVPGLANRWLGKIVKRIFISLPGSEKYFPTGRTRLTGNPVRAEILAAGQVARSAQESGGFTLLVLGGSQGAHRLNQLVLEGLISHKAALPANFLVIHQTGRQDEALVREGYQAHGINARVSAFFDDMAGLYSQADLLVSRAGATSLAELCVMGRPAILLPYPHAADNHQEFNARQVVEKGGALLFNEAELTAARLGDEIVGLLGDGPRRRRMGECARAAAFPEATASIVCQCLELLKA
ncbi:MAG: undecaprenyldiphospho-muramoylpentapeptide beta-N-acetylglucosaminyltransferase [Desulfobulbaceae bacterium]|nr:undecaprenyldiphospho-muramoylpentapeptide beta-N-acetylglucosaminyltransferase [Desulfobulbaceae bacterium]